MKVTSEQKTNSRRKKQTPTANNTTNVALLNEKADSLDSYTPAIVETEITSQNSDSKEFVAKGLLSANDIDVVFSQINSINNNYYTVKKEVGYEYLYFDQLQERTMRGVFIGIWEAKFSVKAEDVKENDNRYYMENGVWYISLPCVHFVNAADKKRYKNASVMFVQAFTDAGLQTGDYAPFEVLFKGSLRKNNKNIQQFSVFILAKK